MSDKDSVQNDSARVTRECPQCHGSFDPGRWKGQYERRFCSTKCRWDYHNNQRLNAVDELKTVRLAARTLLLALDKIYGPL